MPSMLSTEVFRIGLNYEAYIIRTTASIKKKNLVIVHICMTRLKGLHLSSLI